MQPAPVRIRILIVNDQLVVREGLRMLIENHPGTKVIGMARTRAEAFEIIAREPLDLIILDLELGGESALSFIPQLREASKASRILVLTGARDSETHREAAQLGAMGVVLKDDAADLLLKAIEKVYAGEAWLDRVTMGNLLWQLSAPSTPDLQTQKIASLTDREREVVGLIAQGLKNKQIAARLFISQTTVTHHLSSIYAKLGVADRLELVIYALRHGLAPIPK